MLLELKVSHFAIIDKLEVHFLRPGLNILTGETGAGKSVLLKSLSLLLGGKASTDAVRTGNDQAEIEGAFDISERPDVKAVLEEVGLLSKSEADEGTLIVRRVISASGKNRVYINGHISTLSLLERVVPMLVEITGQHEHHSLTKAMAQIDLVDHFGETFSERTEFFELREKKKNVEASLEDLLAANRDREQRMDFLKFQISEISAFDPKPDEDRELASSYERARHSEKLRLFAQNAENFLSGDDDGGVQSRIYQLIKDGETLLQIDSSLSQTVAEFKTLAQTTEDLSYELSDYKKKNFKNADDDSQSMESVEERLSQLKKLLRKYGPEIKDLIAFKETAEREYETLSQSEENIKLLQAEITKLSTELWKRAENLSVKRKAAALKMSQSVNKELKDLHMKGAIFSIDAKKTEQLQTTGCDEITFMIKAAPQEPERALSRVASGGELSRIMLALKQVVAMSDLPMTYLFDEVDTGVSGPTAEKVGRKLKSIARAHQVICITHLPQVACFADAHFLISKEVSRGFVKSEVKELAAKDRVQELGRLISGEKITATSLAHAKQMLAQADA